MRVLRPCWEGVALWLWVAISRRRKRIHSEYFERSIVFLCTALSLRIEPLSGSGSATARLSSWFERVESASTLFVSVYT